MYVYVLCYDVLCVAWCMCTLHCPLLLCPASLSVPWVGWHRCLTVCMYAHIVQTIASHLLSLLLLLLYILYNIYYNYTHSKYDICLHYTVSCEEAMLYTNSCIYYTMLYYVYMYVRPIPTVIYDYVYNLTYYINIL